MLNLEKTPRILRPTADHVHRILGSGELTFPTQLAYQYQRLQNYPTIARHAPWSVLRQAADYLRHYGNRIEHSYDLNGKTLPPKIIRNSHTNQVEAVRMQGEVFLVEHELLIAPLSPTYRATLNWHNDVIGLRSRQGEVFYVRTESGVEQAWSKVTLSETATAEITALLEDLAGYYPATALLGRPLQIEPKSSNGGPLPDWYSILITPTEASWRDGYGNVVTVSLDQTRAFTMIPQVIAKASTSKEL